MTMAPYPTLQVFGQISDQEANPAMIVPLSDMNQLMDDETSQPLISNRQQDRVDEDRTSDGHGRYPISPHSTDQRGCRTKCHPVRKDRVNQQEQYIRKQSGRLEE